MSRASYHLEHAERARDEARRLLAERERLGARWLSWVATELYQLKPPQYAAMVRRELQQLSGEA